MKQFLLQFFTWWNGQTLGVRFFTWRKGEFVGKDELGNSYYRQRDGAKRWVVYDGYAEATAIPPGWHAWMHHRTDDIPAAYDGHEWEKPHQPNATGSAAAYRPPGSILHSGPRTPGKSDYEPWTPR
jgi:NADH:ubiquinone oxidoreductase subunit